MLSLLTPFAAYLAAEAAQVGSILAVVGAALYAGAHDTRFIDAPTRAHSWEVWRMLQFAFNGLVFLLLGVQLHLVVEGLSRERDDRPGRLRAHFVGGGDGAAPGVGVPGGLSALSAVEANPRS